MLRKLLMQMLNQRFKYTFLFQRISNAIDRKIRNDSKAKQEGKYKIQFPSAMHQDGSVLQISKNDTVAV